MTARRELVKLDLAWHIEKSGKFGSGECRAQGGGKSRRLDRRTMIPRAEIPKERCVQ